MLNKKLEPYRPAPVQALELTCAVVQLSYVTEFCGLDIARFLTEEKLEEQREVPLVHKHFIVDLFRVYVADRKGITWSCYTKRKKVKTNFSACINQHKVTTYKRKRSSSKKAQSYKWRRPRRRSYSNPAPEEWAEQQRAKKITNREVPWLRLMVCI